MRGEDTVTRRPSIVTATADRGETVLAVVARLPVATTWIVARIVDGAAGVPAGTVLLFSFSRPLFVVVTGTLYTEAVHDVAGDANRWQPGGPSVSSHRPCRSSVSEFQDLASLR